jgi:AraC-like DNA-binding protein
MKIISFVNEENEKFYDLDTIRRILGASRSKVQRELKRNNLVNYLKYKNQHLYPENTLFSLMEKIMIEKIYRNEEW